ncbi:hypothetical protein PCE1_001753 [Barthelona sp. PCE]
MSTEDIPEWKRQLMARRKENEATNRGVAHTAVRPNPTMKNPTMMKNNPSTMAARPVPGTMASRPTPGTMAQPKPKPQMQSGTKTFEEDESGISGLLKPTGNMEYLIDIVNQMQDILAVSGLTSVISLPQIAVVGAQSAGKSSVLERLLSVGDVLPRNSNMCTRRPLVLQLMHDADATTPVGQFAHMAERKFYDLEEIRNEIVRETDRVCGPNQISAVPINLKLSVAGAVNLTLVDLPGLTKVAVDGQQKNIVELIHAMVERFAANDNTIILAVSPANTDIANSEALAMAEKYDPQHLRTISVLTKLDLMDEGTDAMRVLNGQMYEGMKMIPVVNRSKKQTDQGQDLNSAAFAEEQYFQHHEAYHAVAHRAGTGYLAKVLNTALINHIKACLPDLRRQISTKLNESERELSAIGDDDSDDGRKRLAFGILQSFSRLYCNIVDGASSDDLERVQDGPHELEAQILVGAKIKHLLTQKLEESIKLADISMRLDDDQIRKYIQNTTGTQSNFNIPQETFEAPIKVGISQLINPVLECVDEVNQQLVALVDDTSERIKELALFPALKQRMKSTSLEIISDLLPSAKDFARELVEMELSYITLGKLKTNKQSKVNQANPEAILFEGFLLKKSGGKWSSRFGRKSNKWERRWFVLKARTLFYFQNPESTAPLGMIPLEDLDLRSSAEVALEGLPIPDVEDWDERRQVMYEQEREELIKNAEETFGEFYMRLSHNSGKAIIHDRCLFEVRGETPEDYASWIEALKRATRGHEQDEENDIDLVRRVVTSYLENVRNHISLQLPKAVMLKMVNPVKRAIERDLMARIYDQRLIDEILAEDPQVKQHRDKLKETVSSLRECQILLKKINES